MRYNYIVIEGNIGAGKTSLATKIAQDYNAKLILEQFEDNAFLPKFYNDNSRYALPLELSFLAQRYKQLKEQLTNQDLFKAFTISDYFIDKSLIFAKKTLQDDELKLFINLFNIISSLLPKPDLLVYLHVGIDRLKSNITKRGRFYEQNIKASYLEKIQESYFEYIEQQQNKRILIINANKINFVESNEDYHSITDIINQEYDYGINRINFF